MCGIAGICNYSGNPIRNIKAMNEKLVRRGPDAGDYWVDENCHVVLGHRRLSILDLSETGKQPMFSADGRYVIVFNGEVYNYKAVLQKMCEEGFARKLRGESDTEVLVEAISFWGFEKTLKVLKGMFAIAVFDREDKILFLARDRMGEKPLYYGKVNESFVFASDLAAIKEVEGFQNVINQEVLGLYFHYGYIPQPYSIYKDIWKLAPGSFLKLSEPFHEGSEIKYWDIVKVACTNQEQLFCGNEAEASLELERLLRSAIREQMVADVPVGAFLSGGIDSTAVVSLMQQESSQKIKTFTIGFNEKGYNEAVFAKEETKYIGTDHTELYVGFNEVMDILPQLPKAFSEPFADSSQIPTMLVSQMTREHVTVSLSGDGGDELFCGYNTYKTLKEGLQIVKSKAAFLPNPIRKGIGNICKCIANAHTPLLYKVGNCFTMETAEDYKRSMVLRDCRIPYIAKNERNVPCGDDIYPDGLLEKEHHNLMLMDLMQYMPEDILVKVDRAGMFFSLETRMPLLDKDVVEFAWKLPLSYKYDGEVTKKVLRNALYRYVPKEMMERPKTGFGIPIAEWLSKGEMREWAESIMMDARGSAKEFLNIKVVESFWKDLVNENRWQPNIWYILMFEQWLLENKIV